MPRKYLQHDPKPIDNTFKVRDCPEVEKCKRWCVYRRSGLKQYLWPDGTIHNFLVGTVKLGEVLDLEDYPGYFSSLRSAKAALRKYNKEHGVS